MSYTNSSLVNYTKLSPNQSGQRTHTIDRITPHCVVGQLSVETLGSMFAQKEKQASCQYAIGADGRVLLCVEEKNRSWCSSSNTNDQRAVTIECASDATHPYAFNDKVYNKLIDLCADICKRNGKNKLIWISDKTKALAYEPKSNEMLLTVHRWFKAKACPGDWLMARMNDLATKVTAKLAGKTEEPKKEKVEEKPKTEVKQEVKKEEKQEENNKTSVSYEITIEIDNLNIRKGPGTNFSTVGRIKPGKYTIIKEAEGKGATKWGKLKSGLGWISLDFIRK